MHRLRRRLVVFVPVFAAAFAAAQTLTVAPDRAEGIYKAGEKAVWTVTAKDTVATQATYSVKFGGLTERARGSLALVGGLARIEGGLEEPGSLLVDVAIPGTNGAPVKALSGAVFSPEGIRPSAERPDDFDAFWQAKLGKLAQVPANPRLEAADGGRTNVAYWRITMDNIGGTHINGQLARPEQGEKFPAVLIVQWAGVYPLQKAWVTGYAGDGWLALNILAHDLPIDAPAEFYKEQSEGPLKDYTGIGNADRETSYFLRMYLSCYRAAEYLSQRPDWDGRTLVVTGGSQGGLQTFVTAALHPKITAGSANVPAGCDAHGPDVGRLPGWPMWYNKVGTNDAARVRAAAGYYDVVNFASRVTCPMLVGVGLIDTTCPPAGVYAACNRLGGPKEVVLMPRSGHSGKDGVQESYNRRHRAWMDALRQGRPAPVAQP